MAFHEPIGQREGSQILAWHDLGLSPRDIRDLMQVDGYRYPLRSMDGIRTYLHRYGRTSHPSQRGPKPDGRETHCASDRHPGETFERKGKNNDCPRCKVLRAREKRVKVRAGLTERIEVLRGLGDEAAEIADWIEGNVRVA